MRGARPNVRELDDFVRGIDSRGWQHKASFRVEEFFRQEQVFPALSDSSCALLRSQGGSGAWMALSACPTCRVTKIDSHLFRSSNHHRAACARAGEKKQVLARRAYVLENVAARICREAGGRVSTNVFVRDLDLMEPGVADGRRLEVVVNGLPLFGGSQWTQLW